MKSDLNVLTVPLNKSSLIEANAGTGKTYNITALFTRMIVEERFPVESILVVTYTNAAVSDLKGKIYKRLCAVRDGMQNLLNDKEVETGDSFVAEYVNTRQDSLNDDVKYMQDAVRGFDQCSIFTIHSFCRRMLKENAFSGRIAYDVELTGDSRELIRRPVYDYWRKNAYKAPISVMKELTRQGPESLIRFYMQVQSSLSVEVLQPEKLVTPEDTEKEEKALRETFEAVKDEWIKNGEEVTELLDPSREDFPLDKRSYNAKLVASSFYALNRHISSNDIHCDTSTQVINRLTQSFIDSKSTKGPLKHPFFELVQRWYENEDRFQKTAADFAANFRYGLCEYMGEVFDQYKQDKDLQSYDDLITRMRDAVTEDSGHGEMTASLHKRYRAALIDEFQDTDPCQYDIFSTAFAKFQKPLFMIGDPKQAIYSFRGADVYAYLKASKNEENQFTLRDNYRSDPNLVEAVNELFRVDNPFKLDEIKYNPSNGASEEFRLEINGQGERPLTIWECGETTVTAMAEAAARHIAELLNTAETGNAKLNGRKVEPSDIAVLCRSKSQQAHVKKALAKCLVPAVVSGSVSVFAGDEALEIAALLNAVMKPFSQKEVKTALATPFFEYTAERIYRIEEREEWDRITEKFRRLNDLINIKGFAPMFFHLTADTELYQRAASAENGERKLTNYIHITELIQKFEAEKKAAPQDILNWLKRKISDKDQRDDEAELKMDSDENAVTIITIHKSKGLEYNIVYAPYLNFSAGSNREKRYPKYHRGDSFVMDISDEKSSRELASAEELAEDLRLCYVALTRAKSVCYTARCKAKESYKTGFHYLMSNRNIVTSPMPDTALQIYKTSEEKPSGRNRTFEAEIGTPWRINSFSGLIHSSSSPKDRDQFTLADTGKRAESSLDIFSFPKGAKAGTCLHECMEEIQFENYNRRELLDTVKNKLEVFSFDTDFAPAVTDSLIALIEKDISGVKLAELCGGDYLPEMEFHIHSKDFSSEKIAGIFDRNGETEFAKAAETLSFEAVQGYLNGFADLIFRQNGKYYLLDWKSNHLGMETDSYRYEKMQEEMISSHYYMQMYIYLLALHLHLKRSLTDYSYDTHMGGGMYIFMRGINSRGDEGIYKHLPKEEIITELEELIRR